MIGTGKAKGDVMQIDLVRYNPSEARKKTRSAATVEAIIYFDLPFDDCSVESNGRLFAA